MTAAALVRKARLDAGLTQVELASRARTSQPVIARLEREGANPRIATLQRVLAAAGARLDLQAAEGPGPLDETQIVQRLALSPAERLQAFTQSQRNLSDLKRRARRVPRPPA
jgi:transcriptional regulator with XRE-family HTH domain